MVEVLDAMFIRSMRSESELWIVREPSSKSVEEMIVKNIPPHEVEFGEVLASGGVLTGSSAYMNNPSGCSILLDALFRTHHQFAWPTKFILPGIIKEEEFNLIWKDFQRELACNAAEAATGNSEIVTVARELGLSPHPSGTSPHAWYARCPETNHDLMIGAKSGTFGCGWCGGKGGPDELRAFVKKRRAWAKELYGSH